MKSFKHYATAALGLSLFVTVVALSLPQTGHGTAAMPPDKDVKVINTAAEPVPVNVINSQVKVQQSGTWNVGINGTPTVQIGNAAPITVRDADRPTAQPYQVDGVLTLPEGFGGENLFFMIPAGKILVIENVSAISHVGSDQTMDSFSVMTKLLPENNYRTNYLSDQKREYATQTIHTVSESVRLYSENSFAVRATRLGSSGSVTVRYTVSGHLVDK